jgi:hypothetical protein
LFKYGLIVFVFLFLLSSRTPLFRHLVGSSKERSFNYQKAELFRLVGLLMVIAFSVLPLTMLAQNPVTILASDVGLPDAPGRSSVQASGNPSPALGSSASVMGTVLDINGFVIPKARVMLSGPGGVRERITESDINGKFTFADLGPGTYTVTIASAGLETFVSAEIILAAGEKRELPETALPIATANTDVRVFASRDEVAAAQVQLAEKQRVLGILPNFYSSYIWDAAPLTPKLKFNLALRSTTDPVTFLITGGLAGVEQAHNTFPGYGGGPEGYAKRYGAAYADNVIGRMIGSAILPSVFRQDPRYFYKGTGSITSRALYAIGATVIARGDNGHSEPTTLMFLGTLRQQASQTSIVPPQTVVRPSLSATASLSLVATPSRIWSASFSCGRSHRKCLLTSGASLSHLLKIGSVVEIHWRSTCAVG